MPELENYYARRAAEYEEIYALPDRASELRELERVLRSKMAGRRVLEPACGTGFWTERMAPAVQHVRALDINEEVLTIARQKNCPPGRVEFSQADAYQLPSFGERFDAALLFFWWSHMPKEKIPAFLKQLHARLEPGAVILIADNRFIPGSSTPIARADASGNTFQQRKLKSGEQFEVLKNFPDRAELAAALSPYSVKIDYRELGYYWIADYLFGPPQPARS